MSFEKDLYKFIPEHKIQELVENEGFDLDDDAIEVNGGYIIPVDELNEMEDKTLHVPTLKEIIQYSHEFILEFGDEKNPTHGMNDDTYTESIEQYINDRVVGRVRNTDDFIELYNLK